MNVIVCDVRESHTRKRAEDINPKARGSVGAMKAKKVLSLCEYQLHLGVVANEEISCCQKPACNQRSHILEEIPRVVATASEV